jgi:hypothetical protein
MGELKRNWEVVEHSWSDTSIMCGDKTICTMSIYDEATEETQNELEDEVSRNFKLIVSSPHLLDALQDAVVLIRRLKLSMLAHPDCTEGSEFDDYTSSAQEFEDSAQSLIDKATSL